MTTTLVIGAGYVGGAVARRLLGDDADVFGMGGDKINDANDCGHANVIVATRSGQFDHPDRPNLLPVRLDVTNRQSFDVLREVPTIDRVLYSVGYRASPDQTRDDVHVTGQRRLLEFLCQLQPDHLPHFVTLSTTGVYQQSGGQWVDERSPTHPTRPGGQTHLRSESVLRRHWPADKQTTLRLAGIYGPDRWPNRRAIAAGKPINADPESYLNLIHRDDIVTAVIAAMDRRATGLFCVADDHPVRRREYYDAVARSVGLTAATFDTNGCTGDRRSTSNKRIWNRKAKTKLVARWRYPSSIAVVEKSPA